MTIVGNGDIPHLPPGFNSGSGGALWQAGGPSYIPTSVAAGVITDPIQALGAQASTPNVNSIPVSFGMRLVTGEVIWVGDLSVDTRTLVFEDATLRSATAATNSELKGDFAIGFGYSMVPNTELPNGTNILRMWVGNATTNAAGVSVGHSVNTTSSILIYDAANPSNNLPGMTMSVHGGLPGQTPDPIITARDGDNALSYRNMIYVVFKDFPLWLLGTNSNLPIIQAELGDTLTTSVGASLLASSVSPGAKSRGTIMDWANGLYYTFSGSPPNALMHVFSAASASPMVSQEIRTIAINTGPFPGTFLRTDSFLVWDRYNSMAFTILAQSSSNTVPIVSLRLATGVVAGSFGVESNGTTDNAAGFYSSAYGVVLKYRVGGAIKNALVVGSAFNDIGLLGYTPDGTAFTFGGADFSHHSGLGSTGGSLTEYPIMDRADLQSKFPNATVNKQDGFYLFGGNNQIFLTQVTGDPPTIAASGLLWSFDAAMTVGAMMFDPNDGNVVVFLTDISGATYVSKLLVHVTQSPSDLGLVVRADKQLYLTAIPAFNPALLASAMINSRIPNDIYAYPSGSNSFQFLNLANGLITTSVPVAGGFAGAGSDYVYDGATNSVLLPTGTISGTEGGVLLTFTASNFGGVTLANALRWMVLQGGYAATDISVDGAITDVVKGGLITTQTDLWTVMGDIAATFNFVFFESDGLVKFRRPGEGDTAAVAVSLTEEDLGDLGGNSGSFESVITTSPAAHDAPDEVDLAFYDFDLLYTASVQPYHLNNFPPRVGRSATSILKSYTIPFVIHGTDAQVYAANLCYRLPAVLSSSTFRLAQSRMALEPGDVCFVTLADGSVMQLILQELVYNADWSISAGAGNADFRSNSALLPNIPVSSGPPPVAGPTDAQALLFDIPLLNPADEQTSPVLYIGAKALTGTWNGAAYLLKNGAGRFTQIATLGSPAVAGTCGKLPAEPFPMQAHDEYSLVVTMPFGTTGASVSEADFLAGNLGSAALVGDQGRWEVIFYRDMTVAGAQLTLNHITRGRYGTDTMCGTHKDGDFFIPLLGTIAPVVEAIANLAATISAEAIGSTVSVVPPVATTTFTAASKMPWAPCAMNGALASGPGSDIVITWSRRDRLGGDWATRPMPMSEAVEKYDIVIENGSGVALRTVTGLTSPTYTYTAANQTTDGFSSPSQLQVKVFQISALVGRGYPGEATLDLH